MIVRRFDIRTRAHCRSLVENSGYYARSAALLCDELDLPLSNVLALAAEMDYNVFEYEKGGPLYVGSKQQQHHYYYDKMLGQNPFYQTS